MSHCILPHGFLLEVTNYSTENSRFIDILQAYAVVVDSGYLCKPKHLPNPQKTPCNHPY